MTNSPCRKKPDLGRFQRRRQLWSGSNIETKKENGSLAFFGGDVVFLFLLGGGTLCSDLLGITLSSPL